MNKLIKTIFGVGLLALTGNAAAIMIDEQVYGMSSYTLPEIDQAIEVFREEVSTKREKKLLKKSQKFDNKVEKLGNKLAQAAANGNSKKLKKLIKKEKKLLAILADYLPVASMTLPDSGSPIAGSSLLLNDLELPEPDTLLPILEDALAFVAGSSTGNNLPGPGTATGSGVEATAVPEPAMPALLCLGFLTMLIPRLRRRT